LLLSSAAAVFAQRAPRAFTEGVAQNSRGIKMSPELALLLRKAGTRLDNQRLEVIVQYKNTPSNTQFQKLGRLGGMNTRSLGMIRGGVVTLPFAALRTLANDPEIAYVSPNRPVHVTGLLGGALKNSDFTEETVSADDAQAYGWNGSGITVAVIDSGISDHPDLHDPATGKSRVVYSESFVPGTDTLDHYGHGTHVAGIIAGNGSQSGGLSNAYAVYGVAPNAKLVNLKVLDANGSGSDAYVIAAIQRAIALKSTYNIGIINLSLGRPVYESYTADPLCQAVEAAWRAGIVVVAAAGNSGRDNTFGTNGYGMIGAPGNDPYVLTVGAMNSMATMPKSDDVITTYSSKGPTMVDHVVKPDLVAPGNKVASLLVAGSTLDGEYPSDEVPPTDYGSSAFSQKWYTRLSGTSMATPVVSGAAALMLQQNSGLTPDAIKARLMKTADKSFPQYSLLSVNGTLCLYQYDIFTVGAGYLNVMNALSNTDPIQGNALSPTAMFDSSGNVKIVAAAASVFGNSVVWGNSVIWGNAVLSGTSVVWGNSVVWGSSTVSGSSVIWGNSVVWGNSVDTDDNSAQSVSGNGD
jgi:serine protease AprX